MFYVGDSEGQQTSQGTGHHTRSDEQGYTLGDLCLPVPDGEVPAYGGEGVSMTREVQKVSVTDKLCRRNGKVSFTSVATTDCSQNTDHTLTEHAFAQANE